MEYKILGKRNDIAMIITDEVIIKDTQSALDRWTLFYEIITRMEFMMKK